MTPFQRISLRNKTISALPFLPKMAALGRAWRALQTWERDGWTSPPPYFVRLAMLESEAQAVAAECLIETGTFRGDTIWRFRNRFRKIITIEVQDQLAKLARERFDGYRNIRVIHGDSAKTLSNACVEIDGNCLIYLDGHYSGGFTGLGEEECPVMAEVRTLFSHLKHPFRIIIDDARLFGTDPAYPTRHDILAFLEKQDGDWRFREENDAFVIWRA